LRAKDMEAKAGETLLELRCPEAGCRRLLIRFRQARGASIVETFCEGCQVWAEWTLQDGLRPIYQVVRKRI
jgi:hypothetical protein